MKALASARFDWEQSLRDLSRALPSDVYLSSLKGSLGGGGAGGSGLRTAIGSPALELSGCTRNHPPSPRSCRACATSRASPASASPSPRRPPWPPARRSTGPCGNKAPPSFEVVVFFEKATVDSALADATGVGRRAAAGRRPDGRRRRQARRRPPPSPLPPPKPREARPRDPQKHDPARRGGRCRRGGCVLDARPHAQARRGCRDRQADRGRSRPSSPRPRPRWPPTSRPARATRPTTR